MLRRQDTLQLLLGVYAFSVPDVLVVQRGMQRVSCSPAELLLLLLLLLLRQHGHCCFHRWPAARWAFVQLCRLQAAACSQPGY